MGKWNRRYIPRRKYKHYDYEDDDPPNINHSFSSQNRVPSWELDYCNSLGVPWKKLLASKKYIYAYPSVLNWDGSAAEEALQNAKERYWAMINNLPCNNPLPDPNLYIYEIDWNPQMDHELMAELDLPIFDPDKAQKDEKLETIDEWDECADKNKYTSDNPWESAGSLKDTSDNPWKRNNKQGAGSLEDISDNNPWERSSKDLQGWGRWNDTVDLKNGNTWGGNESWGGSQGFDKTKLPPFINNGCSNSHNFNGQPIAERQGWGRGGGHKGNNSWGWSQGNANAEGQSGNFGYSCEHNYSSGFKERGWRDKTDESWGGKNKGNNSWGWNQGNANAEGQSGNFGYSCEPNYSSGFKERGWGDKTNESWGGKKAEFQGGETNYWDSQTFDRGGRTFRGDCRKRESSVQNTSSYKSSKYHRDTYRDSRQL